MSQTNFVVTLFVFYSFEFFVFLYVFTVFCIENEGALLKN